MTTIIHYFFLIVGCSLLSSFFVIMMGNLNTQKTIFPESEELTSILPLSSKFLIYNPQTDEDIICSIPTHYYVRFTPQPSISQFHLIPHNEGKTLFILPFPTISPSFVLAVPKLEDEFVTSLTKQPIYEPATLLLFQQLLQDRCRIEPETLVIDVGSNVGYYTIFSGKLGCKVLSIEPQKKLISSMQASLELNSLTHMITLEQLVISDDESKLFSIAPGRIGCSGCARVRERSKNSLVLDPLKTRKIDSLVTSEVFLLKVDVQGHEVEVLRSAQKLFGERKIVNAIVEWRSKSSISEMGQNLLLGLMELGYEISYYPSMDDLSQELELVSISESDISAFVAYHQENPSENANLLVQRV